MIDRHPVPVISAADAHARLSGELEQPAPLLVDVRERNEFLDARAVGAALLPLSEFGARYTGLPRDRPLLMICHSGARSGRATEFLLANGWSDVTNVAGGTLAWAQAGLPVRRGPMAPGEGDLPTG